MELILTYALVVCGSLALFLYLGLRPWVIRLYETRVHVFILRQIVYPFLYRRFRLLGPGAVAIAVLIATLWLRRPYFELFTKTHTSLGLFTIVAICLHLRATQGVVWQYAAISIALYAVLVLVQLSTVLFQNLIQQRRGARAYVSLRGKDGILLTLNLEKAVNAKPGQFIYVWMACSPLQTHPFMVISEHENTLSVLVQSQSGFSRQLKSIAEVSDPDTAYLAWIDGPYGSPPDFGRYRSVILVANGIGVAAHLAVLKTLLLGYQERSAKVRSIVFYWQVANSDNRNWVKEWLDELIKMDHDKIMKVCMYQPEATHHSQIESWGGSGRVERHFDLDSFMGDLASKVGEALGDTIVSVSAQDFLRDETRRMARDKLFQSRNVVYHVLDFQVQKSLRPWRLLTGKL